MSCQPDVGKGGQFGARNSGQWVKDQAMSRDDNKQSRDASDCPQTYRQNSSNSGQHDVQGQHVDSKPDVVRDESTDA